MFRCNNLLRVINVFHWHSHGLGGGSDPLFGLGLVVGYAQKPEKFLGG